MIQSPKIFSFKSRVDYLYLSKNPNSASLYEVADSEE